MSNGKAKNLFKYSLFSLGYLLISEYISLTYLFAHQLILNFLSLNIDYPFLIQENHLY